MTGFNINHVVLSGNLTRDAELRSTPSGTSVCHLRIANNTRRKDSSGEWVDKPNFFSVTVWGGIGEAVASRVGKGDRVVVSGRIEWREWEDQNGNKRQDYDVIADSVVDAAAGSSGGSGGSYQSDVPADTGGLEPAAPPASPAPARGGGPDDDIPF